MNAATASLQQMHATADEHRLAEQKAGEQRAHEPSMEEILASIRRIIADDSAVPLARKAAPPLFREAAPVAAPVVQPAPHAVHLAPAQPEQSPAPVPEPPAVFLAPDPAVAAPEPALAELPPPAQAAEEEDDVLDLAHPDAAAPFAEPAAAPVWTAAPALAHAPRPVFQVPPPAPEPACEALLSPGADAAVASSFQTLAASMFLNNKDMVEAMTREMLRPMLKSWLDDNLPVLVERLVRIEIERVARGGR